METLIRKLYKQYLGRDVEPEGLQVWSSFLAGGRSEAELIEAIAGSDEAQQRIAFLEVTTRASIAPVDIIIPFFNHAQMTLSCLTRLVDATENFRLILIDDYSLPEEGARVAAFAARRSDTLFIRNPKNLGFQESVRRALRFCSADYVCVMNNDVIVKKGWLNNLVQAFFKSRKLMLVGPMGGILSKEFLGKATITNEHADYIEFSCAVFRRAMLNFLPIWDTRLRFAYGEDADLSLRLKQMGLEIKVIPSTLVRHIGNQTFGSENVDKRWKTFHAQNLSYLKHKWRHYLKHRTFSTEKMIFQREGAHGDVLCLEPALRAYKIKHPSHEIFLTTACPEVLAFHPFINTNIPNDVFVGGDNLDLAYERHPKMHITKAYAKALGVKLPDPSHPLFFIDPLVRFAEEVTRSPYVIAGAEGSWENRTMPLETFTGVLEEVKSRGYRILEVGIDQDTYTGVGLNLKCRTTIQSLAALIKGAEFVIGHDTLLLHIAEAVGTAGAYVFACTDPSLRFHRRQFSFAIRNEALKCLGCHHKQKPPVTFSRCKKKKRRLACLTALTYEDFKPAIDQLEGRKVNEAAKYLDAFRRYAVGTGLDLGSGSFKVLPNTMSVDHREIEGVDFIDDITSLDRVKPLLQPVDFILASHCLEHLEKPREAIVSWLSLLKDKGYLIIILPHPDLYKEENPAHISMMTPQQLYQMVFDLGVRKVMYMTDEGFGKPNYYSFLLVFQKEER